MNKPKTDLENRKNLSQLRRLILISLEFQNKTIIIEYLPGDFCACHANEIIQIVFRTCGRDAGIGRRWFKPLPILDHV